MSQKKLARIVFNLIAMLGLITLVRVGTVQVIELWDNKINADKVQPGQIWCFYAELQSPLGHPLIDTMKVLAVKDGRVLYISSIAGGEKRRDTIHRFLIGAKRIK